MRVERTHGDRAPAPSLAACPERCFKTAIAGGRSTALIRRLGLQATVDYLVHITDPYRPPTAPHQCQYRARRRPRRRRADTGSRSPDRHRRREDKSIDKSLVISADRQSYPDPQTQARQIILGKPSFDGAATREFSVQSKTNVPPPMSARRDGSAHTDPQELARRMILVHESAAKRARACVSLQCGTDV